MTNTVSTLQDIAITFNDGTTSTFGEAFQSQAVSGVPSNQFMDQEPGTDAEIEEFCQVNYGVTFPLATKTDVNGPDAHPLYRELTAYPAGGVQDIGWNFEKFLVGADGRILGRFTSSVEPLSDVLVDAVGAAL